jgi:hypothetical protein
MAVNFYQLHDVTFHDVVNFIVTAMGTSHLTSFFRVK